MKNKVALSGGLFFFTSILYFNFKYNLNLNIVYVLIPLIFLGFLSDMNFLDSQKKIYSSVFYIINIRNFF